MVAGAQELTEEIARTLRGELSRMGLLPDEETDEWDQLSGCTRERWIRESTTTFLSWTKVHAARNHAHFPDLFGTALSPRELGLSLVPRDRLQRARAPTSIPCGSHSSLLEGGTFERLVKAPPWQHSQDLAGPRRK